MICSARLTARWGTALAAGVLVLVAACGPAFSTTCRVDSDCPVDFRCDGQRSMCVAAVVDAGDAAVADGAPTDLRAQDRAIDDAVTADDVIASDTRTPDASVSDTRVSDSHPTDTHAADTLILDTRAPDTRLPDTRMPDTHMSDTHMPDTRMPDTHMPDTHMPDTRMPDTRMPDTRMPDASPTDRGVGVDVPCGYGCVSGDTCYAFWDPLPTNPCVKCSWSSPLGYHWADYTGQICVGQQTCTCTNGVRGACNNCNYGCLDYSGACCGARNQECCPGNDCHNSVCTMSNFCANTCGSIGDECCAGGYFNCIDAESSCCCGYCISNPSYCDVCPQ